ncbi:ribosome biogenesis GTPase Der [Pelomicrobium methylotrophicum]|uniref:GTPase Der n=1 Tax=Pelomicrobium methylotrophicum TaxID=2602750 RepID=A0A5C7ET60_9PROT|nr:ribosome biogenesis GTPase Der [Pelomicrobium methylotrophicum]TXF11070.1 ribosome biogenesis GTPase Der [Pelomicrobium methylotrophicum]
MKPTLVLVGRPNVGKSTLFNRLTRSREALVADVPGLTRDRHYGHGRIGPKPFLVVDTGGLDPEAQEGILAEMARQTRLAVDEADVVVFLVDARQGVTPQDHAIAEELRRRGRKTLVAVNKAEGLPLEEARTEFFELGLGEPIPISAAHGDRVAELLERALSDFPAQVEVEPPAEHPRIAVVGRPNVGKSTLVNCLLGEERLIVFDQPGTTRDSIEVAFQRDGRTYTLIDTAGLRRRSRIDEPIEKFSVVKTLQSIEAAHVVILVLDARTGIAEQDAHIAGFVLEAGRALVVAVNKWDGLQAEQREQVKREIERKLDFLNFARFHYISAKEGRGVGALMRSVDEAYASATAKLPTPKLTRLLHALAAKQPPPRSGIVRPKLRYAHQGGSNPPLIVIHGNALERLPASYRRYLENSFRREFRLQGTPLRVVLREGTNPYVTKGRR